jgi:RHS repeat-associated protein
MLTDYVKDIAYDEFGQRNFIRYGNDTETTYSYDPVRRWLKNIKTTNANLDVFQNAEYTFDRVGNISKIINSPTNRKITQVFSYDQLYQLKTSDSTFEDTTYLSAKYKNTYSQSYSYDTIGNMTSKISVQNDNRGVTMESLNYSLNYSYSSTKPHQATKIGDLAYIYDPNGNLISKGREGETSNTVKTYYGDLDGEGWVDAAITQTTKADEEVQIDPTGEKYFWNEDNQLVKSVVNGQEVFYSYDTSGQRVVKKSVFGETVYINQFMEVKDDDLATKFIYVGESRIVSKLTHIHDLNGGEYERINTYYHHTDHLGTSNVITDYQGNIYKEIYLDAWGSEWVNRGDTLKKITADFTGKPYDSETKMHYFGARYYDSKTSRWVSPDPAYSEYLNSDKGMGGIYNPVNSQVYHYAGNNPLKYVDPDGNELKLWHYIHIASAVYSTVNFVAGFFGNKESKNNNNSSSTNKNNSTNEKGISPTTGETGTARLNHPFQGYVQGDGTLGFIGNKKNHGGIDIHAWENDTVYSMGGGTILDVLNFPDKDNVNKVIILTANGYTEEYTHVTFNSNLKKGDTIDAGQAIGTIDDSGKNHNPSWWGGWHLHLTVRDPDGNLIDPLPYIIENYPGIKWDFMTSRPVEDWLKKNLPDVYNSLNKIQETSE